MAMPPLDLTLIQQLLSSKTISDEISNANDLTTPGFYFVENPNLANMPMTKLGHVYWGHVIVNANTEKSRIEQIYFPDQGHVIWFRDKYDDTWSAWNQLATMDQVTNELTRLLTTVEF